MNQGSSKGRQFEGKVAIVTGGAMGIGLACSATLSRRGAIVVLADINPESGTRAVSVIEADGGDAVFVRTDVGQPEDVASKHGISA